MNRKKPIHFLKVAICRLAELSSLHPFFFQPSVRSQEEHDEGQGKAKQSHPLSCFTAGRTPFLGTHISGA